MMNRWIGLFLFLILGFFSEKMTWGFTLEQHHLPPLNHPSFGKFPIELHNSSWKLEAQGGQSFVFFSDDGKYVLKFFKDQPRSWLLSPSYQAQKNKKLHRTLQGYLLMAQRCPHLAGLIHLHTQHSSSIPVTLVDRSGISYKTDLNSFLFVLQQRAEPLQAPTRSIEKEQLLLDATRFLHLLAHHQLHDHDPRLHLNMGRLHHRLILLDPGKVASSPAPPKELPEKFKKFVQ